MALQLERHLFTLEQYERMIDAGVFEEDERVELIRGEIIAMTPLNHPHEACVVRLTRLFILLTVDQAVVWPQGNSLRIPNHSRPEPDLTLLRWRDDLYAAGAPALADVLLVIEVSDSSLKYDQEVKGPLYAQAGIPEYWIVNLREQVIEVYADPVEGTYRRTSRAKRGAMRALPPSLQGALKVSDILGPPSAV